MVCCCYSFLQAHGLLMSFLRRKRELLGNGRSCWGGDKLNKSTSGHVSICQNTSMSWTTPSPLPCSVFNEHKTNLRLSSIIYYKLLKLIKDKWNPLNVWDTVCALLYEIPLHKLELYFQKPGLIFFRVIASYRCGNGVSACQWFICNRMLILIIV